MDGDPDQPKPPESRKWGRNAQEWRHLFNRDIISMPDKWEYPWVSKGLTKTNICSIYVLCVSVYPLVSKGLTNKIRSMFCV